jgi:uncharacterized protein (TIGR00251 family)
MSRITIQLIPNAKQNAIVGYESGAWKIRITAPPIEGRANEALIDFLSDILDLPKSGIEIMKGRASRKKILEIQANSSEIEEAFTKCVQDGS